MLLFLYSIRLAFISRNSISATKCINVLISKDNMFSLSQTLFLPIMQKLIEKLFLLFVEGISVTLSFGSPKYIIHAACNHAKGDHMHYQIKLYKFRRIVKFTLQIQHNSGMISLGSLSK